MFKKIINNKLALAVAASFIVILTITILLILNNFFISNSTADEERFGTLATGKYMHISGDKNKYVEVFQDNTIQIFGYDGFEETINIPENKENYAKLNENQFKEAMNELTEYMDWFNQRHPYVVDKYVNFVVFDKSSRGLLLIDEKTLSINDDNIYVYKG